MLQITAPISPGSSGSPVINMRGEVVGIATMTRVGGQSLNFAVSPLSIKRNFSKREIYLVENDMPIVENDSMTDSLRVNASAKVLSRSPAHEKARVLETKELEVRTIAKVRSITGRRTYWIDASSVKKPVNMTLDEFIEKFNEGSTFGSERISREDFSLSENKAVRVNAKNYRKAERDTLGKRHL